MTGASQLQLQLEPERDPEASASEEHVLAGDVRTGQSRTRTGGSPSSLLSGDTSIYLAIASAPFLLLKEKKLKEHDDITASLSRALNLKVTARAKSERTSLFPQPPPHHFRTVRVGTQPNVAHPFPPWAGALSQAPANNAPCSAVRLALRRFGSSAIIG
ncbi:hypothetical protein C2E23DRAFT_885323 [Lenzites betulinus]|nr:hypothetical protein C2E23DRAFT_885323 [Lenzites betulinus]